MIDTNFHNEVQNIAQKFFGIKKLKELQLKIISDICFGKNVLAIMPTGYGKSICYQLPTLMLDGVAVIISPLISIMQEQVAFLNLCEINAIAIHGSLDQQEIENIKINLKSNKYKFLYLTPERLFVRNFFSFLSELKICLFAIDEAHCISQWGKDFRPEYRNLGVLQNIFCNVPKLALTATADSLTKNDIVKYLLFKEYNLYQDTFDRKNIYYQVIAKNNSKLQLLKLLKNIPSDYSGIIYCFSRDKVEKIYLFLKNQGYKVGKYHAGLDYDERKKNQNLFYQEQVSIMVATNAFGMGVNKINIRYVVHLDMPDNIESFYQAVGRAGRDELPAISYLFFGLSDYLLQRVRIFNNDLLSEDEKKKRLKKLKQLLEFCELSICRRVYLLDYFNEESKKCDFCDNCKQIPTFIDSTEDVLKLLSCVYRTGQKQSITYIIDILHGKISDEIKSNKHQELKLFGIGKNLSIKKWRIITRKCISNNYLSIYKDTHIIQLTDKFRTILKDVKNIKILFNHTDDDYSSIFNEMFMFTQRQVILLKELKKLREMLSKTYLVNEYLIFNDRILFSIVKNNPLSIDSLRDISGLGEHQINIFGSFVVDTVLQTNKL